MEVKNFTSSQIFINYLGVSDIHICSQQTKLGKPRVNRHQ